MMNGEEWKETYKKAVQDLKEQYNKAMEEWKQKFGDVKMQIKTNVPEVTIPPLPPMPSMPSLPTPFPIHVEVRSNVVASRIGDEELKSIDLLVEAGLFETRSEAVAFLVREGVKARRDTLGKVTSALEDIRKLRKEAEEQVANLKKNVGMAEPEETKESEERNKSCQKCGKDLSELPKDIAVCPYCGTRIRKD